MFIQNYMFDNTRFFSAKSKDGKESGWDGWVKITAKGYREYLPGIDPSRSVLVIIDMQKECCSDWPAAIAQYDKQLANLYSNRLNEIVIPNLANVITLFRQKDLPIIYVTLDKDNIIADIAPSPKRLGSDNWWLRENKEFIIAKYSSGAFATSSLDNVLKESGIQTIFFAGVDTCGCVDATMTEAYDRAYQTILIEDACCSSRPELHEAAVKIWAYKGFVRTVSQIISDYPWQNWIDPDIKKY